MIVFPHPARETQIQNGIRNHWASGTRPVTLLLARTRDFLHLAVEDDNTIVEPDRHHSGARVAKCVFQAVCFRTPGLDRSDFGRKVPLKGLYF